MKTINTIDNTGVTLILPKRKVNHLLISIFAAGVTLINVYGYMKDGISMVDLYIHIIAEYTMSVLLLILITKAVHKLFCPSKLEISGTEITLVSGLLLAKIDARKISVEENPIKKQINEYVTDNPVVIILITEKANISIVVDKEEVAKLN